MSHNSYFISDTHFGHANIINFLRDDGTKLRPFNSIEEHDETLISNWNSVVKPTDRIYCLGDCVIHRKHLPIFSRLNGRKKLIRGNHDLFKLEDYTPYFEDMYGCYVLKGLILSHIPIHPNSMGKFGTNVHGHLHAGEVTKHVTDSMIPLQEIDNRYISVCCEHINYTPQSIEELRERIKERA